MQDLHLFRATKVLPELFEYEYASQFRVTIPCRNFAPIGAKVEISRLQPSRSLPDDFPVLSRYFLDSAARQIPNRTGITTRQVGSLLRSWMTTKSELYAFTDCGIPGGLLVGV